MRSKPQNTINLQLLTLLCFFFLFLLVLKLGSNFSSLQQTPQFSTAPCDKIPQPLARALVHYASSNITPQQTFQELEVTLRVLEQKSPCNFLIFGLRNDSLMWSMLNQGGRTVFLEESEDWMNKVKRDAPSIEAYHVAYDTDVTETVKHLHLRNEYECKEVIDPRSSNCYLALKNFPNQVYNVEWDLIMIDSFTGFHVELPGRITAIYTAGLMARNRKYGETDVFVHDIDRWAENKFSMTFLCKRYWREEVGKLRHFIIPSHRVGIQRPFCP